MDTPAQSASVFGNDNIVVQASGSGVNVTIGPQPHLRLTRYVNQTKLEIQRDSETAWLSAYRADVVPLVGREDAKGDLRAWLNGDAPVSVRVLVGAGGRGKTRLALEMARDISEEGWLAGFATAENFDRFRRQNGVEDWRWDKAVLVIIDYAASRADQLRAWVRELVDTSFDGRPKLRLLLLERQANRAIGWHATVFGPGDDAKSRAANALLDPEEPIELPALDDLEFRRQVFGTLLKRASRTLEAPAKGGDSEFDRLLADHKWAGDPLYLMMAGLAAAKSGVKGALSLSRADLALTMGRNELDRIGRIAAARGVDEKHRFPGAFARHMAAITTLLQGLTVVEAREIAASEIDELRSAAPLDGTINALTDALPGSDASGSVAPILPDVVGEGAILAWFGPTGGLATSGVDVARRIMAVARASVGRASATLVRIAQDFAEAGYAEPIQWLESLAGGPKTDLGALMEIANALPDNTVALREVAADLHQRIAGIIRGAGGAEQGARSSDQVQPILASALNNLGKCLSRLGRREDALAAAQEAANINRRLAAARPDAFLSDLAGSLNNLGNCLSYLGRREDALDAAQEAADINRRLADARPDAFLPDLAGSLNNLGNCLNYLGRREDALAAAQEAAGIYRRLADARPDAFLPDLASSLNNLGNCFGELGHRNDALAAAREALDIYRRLAAARPEAFLPGLAMSHNNVGNCLSELARREDAFAAAQEALDIYRHLADVRPDAFLPNLALSLNNLGNRLIELGRREDALAATQEATNTYRRLADAGPDAFLPDLATSLNNLGGLLSNLGRREDALAAAQEALNIRRLLAAARPDTFLPGLASSLNNLSSFLSNLGRREDALAAAQEAVETLAPLFLNLPAAYGKWMTIMVRQYRESCEALSIEPDAALLTPIFEAFEKLKSSQTDPDPNA
jgi:tetratricopeptide (TPR) repeat protein